MKKAFPGETAAEESKSHGTGRVGERVGTPRRPDSACEGAGGSYPEKGLNPEEPAGVSRGSWENHCGFEKSLFIPAEPGPDSSPLEEQQGFGTLEPPL